MKKIYCFLSLIMILSGCASKMAYLNTQKPPEEVKKDKAGCQATVDTSDFKDAELKQNKFDQCMKDKGYNVVSEDEAEKLQGFKELWIKPGADFKAYEAVFIEKVDLAPAKTKDPKVSDEDINNLSEEMSKRFSKAVSVVMSVITDKEKAAGKKVLYISLKLNSISRADVGANVALQAAGQFVPLPLPGGPEGTFSLEGVITDYPGNGKLITITDEVKSGKNSSLAGFEKFSQWQYAYNAMDYWADNLAALLAKERGQEYKSQLGVKIF